MKNVGALVDRGWGRVAWSRRTCMTPRAVALLTARGLAGRGGRGEPPRP
jgi:hypothetical protein